jgi:hypothetical protein
MWTIRVTLAQHAELGRRAQKAGKSVSEWALSKLLEGWVEPKPETGPEPASADAAPDLAELERLLEEARADGPAGGYPWLVQRNPDGTALVRVPLAWTVPNAKGHPVPTFDLISIGWQFDEDYGSIDTADVGDGRRAFVVWLGARPTS